MNAKQRRKLRRAHHEEAAAMSMALALRGQYQYQRDVLARFFAWVQANPDEADKLRPFY